MLASLIAAAALLLAPGPTNAMLAARGASRSWRTSLGALATVVLSYMTSLGAILCILHFSRVPSLRRILQFASAAVLAILAARQWRARNVNSEPRATALDLASTTLVNPKGLVLALGITELPEDARTRAVSVLPLVIAASSAAWLAFGAWLGKRATGPTGRRVAAAILATFGALMAVAGARSV